MPGSGNKRNEAKLEIPSRENTHVARREACSEMDQGVAPLFRASPEERCRRALPVLREVRALVVEGERVLDALTAQPVTVEREFARWVLMQSTIPTLTLEAVHQWADRALALWLVDRAISRCTRVHASLRGGWRVVSGGRRSA